MIRRNLAIACIGIIICSCNGPKRLAYFKDINDETKLVTFNTSAYKPIRLQANDEIQINISSISPEASKFFNQFVIGAGSAADANSVVSQSAVLNLYTVDLNGKITLPVLGDVVVAGLTLDQLKENIRQKLLPYLKEPVVMVRLTNFKVTVIGEVGSPVVVPVNGQTINVLEAMGAAKDMTPYAVRKNVKIIRKLPDGKTEVAHLNFNKSEVFSSPFFQLKQNDIVYVQPSKSKANTTNRSAVWVPIVTAILTSAAIILSRN